jgi:hypothetical protein
MFFLVGITSSALDKNRYLYHFIILCKCLRVLYMEINRGNFEARRKQTNLNHRYLDRKGKTGL